VHVVIAVALPVKVWRIETLTMHFLHNFFVADRVVSECKESCGPLDEVYVDCLPGPWP
jgi:hypothetical protein